MIIDDLPPIIPAAVQVIFRTDGSLPFYSVTVTLEELDLAAFQSPDSTITFSINADATMPLPSSAIARFGLFGVLINGDDLQALAEQMAEDFYLWELSKLDLVFAGITAWTPEGASDGIEWIHRASSDALDGMVSTRIQRGSWYTFQDQLTSGGSATPPGEMCCNIPCHSWCMSSGGGGGLDLNSFRNLFKSWYGMAVTGQSIGTTVPPAEDKIAAVFFVSPRSVSLAQIGVFLGNSYFGSTGLTGARLRLGIYDIQDPEHPDPRNLVVDGGDLDVDQVAHGANPFNNFVGNPISFQTQANTGYWLVCRSNTQAYSGATPNVTIDWVSNVMEYAMLGRLADGSAAFWYLATLDPAQNPYGALPATAADWLLGMGTSLVAQGGPAPDILVHG